MSAASLMVSGRPPSGPKESQASAMNDSMATQPENQKLHRLRLERNWAGASFGVVAAGVLISALFFLTADNNSTIFVAMMTAAVSSAMTAMRDVILDGVVPPNDPSSATGPATTPERKEDTR